MGHRGLRTKLELKQRSQSVAGRQGLTGRALVCTLLVLGGFRRFTAAGSTAGVLTNTRDYCAADSGVEGSACAACACRTADSHGRDAAVCVLPSFLGGTVQPGAMFAGVTADMQPAAAGGGSGATAPRAAAGGLAATAVAFGWGDSLVVTVAAGCGGLLLGPPAIRLEGEEESDQAAEPPALYTCATSRVPLPPGVAAALRAVEDERRFAFSFVVTARVQRHGSGEAGCAAEGRPQLLTARLTMRPVRLNRQAQLVMLSGSSTAGRPVSSPIVGGSSGGSSSSGGGSGSTAGGVGGGGSGGRGASGIRAPVPESFDFLTQTVMQVRTGEEEQLVVREVRASGGAMRAQVVAVNVTLPLAGLRLVRGPSYTLYDRCTAAAARQAAALAGVLGVPAGNVTAACLPPAAGGEQMQQGACTVAPEGGPGAGGAADREVWEVAAVRLSVVAAPHADPSEVGAAVHRVLSQRLQQQQPQQQQGGMLPGAGSDTEPAAASSTAAAQSGGASEALVLCAPTGGRGAGADAASSSSSSNNGAVMTGSGSSNHSSSSSRNSSSTALPAGFVAMSVLSLSIHVDVQGGAWGVRSDGALQLVATADGASSSAGGPTSGVLGGAAVLDLLLGRLAAPPTAAGGPPPAALVREEAGPPGGSDSAGGASGGVPAWQIGLTAAVSCVGTLLLVLAALWVHHRVKVRRDRRDLRSLALPLDSDDSEAAAGVKGPGCAPPALGSFSGPSSRQSTIAAGAPTHTLFVALDPAEAGPAAAPQAEYAETAAAAPLVAEAAAAAASPAADAAAAPPPAVGAAVTLAAPAVSGLEVVDPTGLMAPQAACAAQRPAAGEDASVAGSVTGDIYNDASSAGGALYETATESVHSSACSFTSLPFPPALPPRLSPPTAAVHAPSTRVETARTAPARSPPASHQPRAPAAASQARAPAAANQQGRLPATYQPRPWPAPPGALSAWR